LKGSNIDGALVLGVSDELKTNLTAAKLKALCILNDLATSGNKSTLIQRLLDAGIKPEDIGLESQTDNNQNAGLSMEDDSSAELSLSLEDEDTLTPEIEPKPRQMATAAAPINEASWMQRF